MRRLFYVDWAMCGGEELPAEFDLEDFCEVLQGKLPETEVIPVTDVKNLSQPLGTVAVSHEGLRQRHGVRDGLPEIRPEIVDAQRG